MPFRKIPLTRCGGRERAFFLKCTKEVGLPSVFIPPPISSGSVGESRSSCRRPTPPEGRDWEHGAYDLGPLY